MRRFPVHVLALSLAASGLGGCGGGSSLDDYEDGLPNVIPAPIKSANDGTDGTDDNDVDTSKPDGGKPDAGKPDASTGGGDSGVNHTGSAQIGDGCKKAADCKDSTSDCTTSVSIGVTLTFPNGYCTQRCSNSSPCPSGSSCVQFANICMKPCNSNTECRVSEGYTCMAPLFGQKYCLPANTPTAPTGNGTGGLLGGLLGG